MRILTHCVLTALALCFCLVAARADEQKVPLDKLPKAVTDAVKAKFPKGKLVEASKEEGKDGKVDYEVSLKDNNQNVVVVLGADGKIAGIEKEIDAKDAPKVVVKALEDKYPKATIKKTEMVYRVEGKEDKLQFYEFTIETADKKTLEVKIDAKGKILD